ncbi:MAG: hypothetical protein KatS3mg003_1500 [Candidatus Nitrosocaldaceae archaeon]|nr:MAG: hypothetical protein KatS3mg003_0710 [Candidatus Nitrosocaldaceae archaeon]GIU72021.1 MAG: hypothetical protein KatS3mg003_1500 [Candidatus Nitrosocaldaceae archaeon]
MKIEGAEIEVKEEFFVCNILKAFAGTTGYRGGDWGHGATH